MFYLFVLLLVLAGCTPTFKFQVSMADIEAREKLNEVIKDCCPKEVSDAPAD